MAQDVLIALHQDILEKQVINYQKKVPDSKVYSLLTKDNRDAKKKGGISTVAEALGWLEEHLKDAARNNRSVVLYLERNLGYTGHGESWMPAVLNLIERLKNEKSIRPDTIIEFGIAGTGSGARIKKDPHEIALESKLNIYDIPNPDDFFADFPKVADLISPRNRSKSPLMPSPRAPSSPFGNLTVSVSSEPSPSSFEHKDADSHGPMDLAADTPTFISLNRKAGSPLASPTSSQHEAQGIDTTPDAEPSPSDKKTSTPKLSSSSPSGHTFFENKANTNQPQEPSSPTRSKGFGLGKKDDE